MIDSKQKRYAMMNFGRTPRAVLPPPSGSIDKSDRFHLLALYIVSIPVDPGDGKLVNYIYQRERKYRALT